METIKITRISPNITRMKVNIKANNTFRATKKKKIYTYLHITYEYRYIIFKYLAAAFPNATIYFKI